LISLGFGGGVQVFQVQAKIAPGFWALPFAFTPAWNAAKSRSTDATPATTWASTVMKKPIEPGSIRKWASRQATART
jgi:hypothetical protein